MKETEIAMVKAIEAAFDFGPHGKRIAYVHILRSALQVSNGFYQYSKGTELVQLIRLMEFHATVSVRSGRNPLFLFLLTYFFFFWQCELKDWQKVETLFRNYVDDAGKEVNAKHDTRFFLNLASIIISTKDAKNCEVVTTECGDDTFQKDRVSVQQQTCLTRLAVTSLKMAIDLSTPPRTLSPEIILCCQWHASHFSYLISSACPQACDFISSRFFSTQNIQLKMLFSSQFRIVYVLFNRRTIWEPITLKENLPLLEELVPWLRSSDFPFPDVNTFSV